MIILAIDPGISGALAFYDTLTSDLDVFDMPVLDGDVNPHEIRAHIMNYTPHLAVIEQVAPMPKEGVRSVWRFASAFTTACVVVKLTNIPLIMVPSAKWKKVLYLKGGKDGKEQARERAIETFPIFAHRFNLKKHHGRAEAALLAVYAAQLNTMRNYEDAKCLKP